MGRSYQKAYFSSLVGGGYVFVSDFHGMWFNDEYTTTESRTSAPIHPECNCSQLRQAFITCRKLEILGCNRLGTAQPHSRPANLVD